MYTHSVEYVRAVQSDGFKKGVRQGRGIGIGQYKPGGSRSGNPRGLGSGNTSQGERDQMRRKLRELLGGQDGEELVGQLFGF